MSKYRIREEKWSNNKSLFHLQHRQDFIFWDRLSTHDTLEMARMCLANILNKPKIVSTKTIFRC